MSQNKYKPLQKHVFLYVAKRQVFFSWENEICCEIKFDLTTVLRKQDYCSILAIEMDK